LEVLAVLADDRRRAIVREFSHARHLRDALVRWKEQRISR
jgi:hypothetical protein